MTEPERIALLLDDSCGVLATSIARRLHEAGLMVVPREPTAEDVERVRQTMMDEFRRYVIDGVSENESGYGGPPYRAPWMLIDTSTSEPEVGWPGELVGEFDDPSDASKEMWRIVARAAWQAIVEKKAV